MGAHGATDQLVGHGGGKRLAQLDAPLVERVDAPDRPLGEDLVLVERDQGPEGEGTELVE